MRITQHFSPACRAAHMGSLINLPASEILRYYMHLQCQQESYGDILVIVVDIASGGGDDVLSAMAIHLSPLSPSLIVSSHLNYMWAIYNHCGIH
jgi:hypothetical protein